MVAARYGDPPSSVGEVMAPGHEQYAYSVFENDKPLVFQKPISDPFIHTTIVPGWQPGRLTWGQVGSRLKIAWQVLRGRYKLVVSVSGSDVAHGAVFTYDYKADRERRQISPAAADGFKLIIDEPGSLGRR